MNYVVWHYRYGLPHLFLITKEFVRFVFNLFSINLFLRTLFLPMFNLQGSARGEEVLADAISIVVGNLVMRVIGLVLRVSLIALGIGCILLVIALMTTVIAFWTFLPAVLLFGVYSFAAALF